MRIYISTCVYDQVLSTMDDCVGDVKGLHSKLERKTNVEVANQEAVARFQQVCYASLVGTQVNDAPMATTLCIS